MALKLSRYRSTIGGTGVAGLVIIPAARRLESMKRLACFTFGLFLALFALPSRSAAKTKVDLKDAQGKPVGDVILWDQGPGVASRANSMISRPECMPSTSIRFPNARDPPSS